MYAIESVWKLKGELRVCHMWRHPFMCDMAHSHGTWILNAWHVSFIYGMSLNHIWHVSWQRIMSHFLCGMPYIRCHVRIASLSCHFLRDMSHDSECMMSHDNEWCLIFCVTCLIFCVTCLITTNIWRLAHRKSVMCGMSHSRMGYRAEGATRALTRTQSQMFVEIRMSIQIRATYLQNN